MLGEKEKIVVTESQKKASRAYRRRSAASGLVRVEVQAARADAGLIRALAETLRTDTERARSLRSTLDQTLMTTGLVTAFDVFGSDLPDERFTDVFAQPRGHNWREADL